MLLSIQKERIMCCLKLCFSCDYKHKDDCYNKPQHREDKCNCCCCCNKHNERRDCGRDKYDCNNENRNVRYFKCVELCCKCNYSNKEDIRPLRFDDRNDDFDYYNQFGY